MKKLLSLLAVSALVLFACKDNDDDIEPVMYADCCQSVFDDTSNFVIFIPNAYTPDGDGLNDKFVIFAPVSNSKVHYITNFSATNYLDKVVFEQDTVLNMQNSNVFNWDLKGSNGAITLGAIRISLDVVDSNHVSHPVSFDICSYTCQSLADENEMIDIIKCRFEDQIDAKRGFVKPTLQPKC